MKLGRLFWMECRMFLYWLAAMLSCILIHPSSRRTNLYSFTVDFRQLHQFDIDYKNDISEIFQNLHKINSKSVHANPSGSVSEGSSVSGFFVYSQNHVLTTELDIEQKILEITSDYQHCVLDNKEKQGFLVINSSCLYTCQKCADSMKDRDASQNYHLFLRLTTCKNGLFCHNNIKSLYSKSDDTRKLGKLEFELIMKAMFPNDIPLRNFSINVTEERTKSSLIRKYYFNFWGRNVSFKLEQAFVIKLQWKTNAMVEWLARHRAWPRQSQIIDEINIAYIIAKVSKEEKSNEESTELRYSFGHLERKLTRLRSQYQNLVYLIFKAMFYKWLHPIDSENITSYIVKTVMLWTCENYPPQHAMWKEDTNSTIKALQHLFQTLHDALKEAFLPYYFIPEINVIKHISHPRLEELLSRVTVILQRIQDFLPRTKNVVEMCELRSYIAKRFRYCFQELSTQRSVVNELLDFASVINHLLAAQ